MKAYLVKIPWRKNGEHALVCAETPLELFFILDEQSSPMGVLYYELDERTTAYIDSDGYMNEELMELIDFLDQNDHWEIIGEEILAQYFEMLRNASKSLPSKA